MYNIYIYVLRQSLAKRCCTKWPTVSSNSFWKLGSSPVEPQKFGDQSVLNAAGTWFQRFVAPESNWMVIPGGSGPIPRAACECGDFQASPTDTGEWRPAVYHLTSASLPSYIISPYLTSQCGGLVVSIITAEGFVRPETVSSIKPVLAIAEH